MSRIGLLEGYDPEKAKNALDLLLRDRNNEFKEIAGSMGIPTNTEEWEIIILKFCLDFEECFQMWTGSDHPDQTKAFKCMTIMREIAKGKKSVTEISHIQNVAYNLYQEFHNIYKRV
ncbi:MAG: hypothetical protein GTN97_03490 [Nitrosopumilaceae archaeon]|nr:hypothetical protein [Nitrosopumilaceae archaeon]NIP09330.1 hypothetical protein [Nitrosopumilaceae archaeon]NIS94973.1 hypothetical protein [Nitrosopumilaceae archaeon]